MCVVQPSPHSHFIIGTDKNIMENFPIYFFIPQVGLQITNVFEAFYSTPKKIRHTGLPLIDLNVYWPAIGNLACVLAYHWSFLLHDVISCIGTMNSFMYLFDPYYNIPRHTVYVTKNDRSLKWSSPPTNEIVTLLFVCVLFIYMYAGVCVGQLNQRTFSDIQLAIKEDIQNVKIQPILYFK